jgi:hypothetical protein
MPGHFRQIRRPCGGWEALRTSCLVKTCLCRESGRYLSFLVRLDDTAAGRTLTVGGWPAHQPAHVVPAAD